MNSYFCNSIKRKIAQLVSIVVQAVLMLLSITFMYLFVSTGAGDDSRDYSLCAIIFTVIFCADYLAQLTFAIITNGKITNKNKLDKAFLILSAIMLPLGAGIYGILLAFM